MRTTWETRHAAKLIGVNPRRLMGWAEKGLLVPSVYGGGKGSRRLYNLDDLCAGVVLLTIQNAVGDRSVLARGDISVTARVTPDRRREDVAQDLVDQVPANLPTDSTISAEMVSDRAQNIAKDIAAQIASGKIKSPVENTFMFATGVIEGIPVNYRDTCVDGWQDQVARLVDAGLSVTLLPLTRPLTELFNRIKEEEEKA